MDFTDLYGILIIAPVFTPVHDDGTLNLAIIPEYARYLHRNHIDGVLVAGTTGEGPTLNVKERKLLLEAWMRESKSTDLKVIAQVGGAPLPDVLELAHHAEHVDADAIMALPELYFKPQTAEKLVDYLETVSKAAPSLPVLYYHFPMMTGVNVNIPEFFRLASARIPHFKGMKADLDAVVQVGDLLRPDQKIFNANHLLGPAALLGNFSSIATVNNLFPTLVRDLVESTKGGDAHRAEELQRHLNRLVATITSQGEFVPSMKATMPLVSGICVGAPRRPNMPIDARNSSILATELHHLGVKIVH